MSDNAVAITLILAVMGILAVTVIASTVKGIYAPSPCQVEDARTAPRRYVFLET